jgi:hypothetical protein
VLAQLEGSGRGALGAYNQGGYAALSALLAELPMREGDAWLRELLRRDRAMGALVLLLVVVALCFVRCAAGLHHAATNNTNPKQNKKNKRCA